mgnify:CR=1 FL=1
MDSGLPPGKPGLPLGKTTRVTAGGSVRQQGSPPSRVASIEAISESIIGITDSLHDCPPVDVLEHVAFLVSEAALAVANSRRCDRLAVQEAAASSEPSYASEGGNCESQELAEEESQEHAGEESPIAGGLTPTAAEEQPAR